MTKLITKYRGIIGVVLLTIIALLAMTSFGLTWVQSSGLLSSDAIVFASDAPSIDKFMANTLKNAYGSRIQICDGTADETEINAAIATLTDGGVARLSDGLFAISASISIANLDSVTLQGSGRSVTSGTDNVSNYKGTTISIAAGADCDAIDITHTTSYCQNIAIKDLTIHGNKANNASGSGVKVNGFMCKFSNVSVEWISEYGFETVSTNHGTYDCAGITFDYCYVRESEKDAFLAGAFVYDLAFDHCYVSGVTGAYDAFAIKGGGSHKLTWCEMDNCDQYGISVTSVNKVQISNCQFSGNITSAQLYIYASNRVTVNDCLFYPYVGAANTVGVLLGLYAATMTDVDIHDNIFYEGKWAVNVSAATTPTIRNVALHHNHFKSQTSAAVNTTVAAWDNITFRDNQGWIGEGETRTYAIPITAGVEDTCTYWQNPFAQDVYIYETRVAITTAASATNPTYDLKLDTDGSGVPDGTALHDAIPDTVGSYWSWSGAYGTDATGVQTGLVTLASNTSTSDWIGFCIEDAAGADVAGVIYITLMGK